MPFVSSGVSGFEGEEEPAEIYFPASNTFASDSYDNIIDEGGGMMRVTLRNTGKNIDREHIRYGSGYKPLCKECADLNRARK